MKLAVNKFVPGGNAVKNGLHICVPSLEGVCIDSSMTEQKKRIEEINLHVTATEHDQ